MNQYYHISKDENFKLIKGDCRKVIPKLDKQFDLVFADPPYFLSNGGDTIQSGKIVKVDKGKWDRTTTKRIMRNFNRKWLSEVRNVMKNDASLWISGSFHNIFNIAEILTDLDFKILNAVTWQKTNPPPHLACRYFTHSTEVIIWARKQEKKAHYFNYNLMKEINDGKQMKDVWTLPAIAPWEKKFGKHPTQKPLSVLTRIILASTKPDALILDPFTGSSTTGIAANLLSRKFIGIDTLNKFLNLGIERKKELDQIDNLKQYCSKIRGFSEKHKLFEIIEKQKT
ncbi:DNA-methyltransferase [Patiriisocius hiemis]|uniref:Methyltransferase n=1 Tax=Patiriisocius hiemis TaxID=3075604 RepID=A0ABU2Y9I7_9FLAO|nr:DNA methyltransferase [Constantimarinum sp. W242]MDT0554501.1 DNA methyltransferase [Constantimarinum sp. W242]